MSSHFEFTSDKEEVIHYRCCFSRFAGYFRFEEIEIVLCLELLDIDNMWKKGIMHSFTEIISGLKDEMVKLSVVYLIEPM
jgi:hypothetical protein